MGNNLRQSPAPKLPKLRRPQDTHHLGRIGHLWGCVECGSIFTHARNHQDATLSHAAHCQAVVNRRENPDDPDHLASGDFEENTQKFPRQGLW